MFSRNYDIDGFTPEEFEEKYKLIRAGLVEGLYPDSERCTIILGGQPGAGKSTFYQMRNDLDNYAAINGDEFRRFHPHYMDIVKTDPENYANRTQPFSNQVVERLISDLASHGYSLIIEGTLRNPEVPIRTCEELLQKGYHADLVVVACDAEQAWQSTLRRAQTQKEQGVMPRLVPIDIYDRTVHQIVDSLAEIESRGCFKNISITNRDGQMLYDSSKNNGSAHEVLDQYLHLENWERKRPQYEREFIELKIRLLQDRLEGRNDIDNIR